MEAVHRDAMKCIRGISPVICLDMLPETELAAVIDSTYTEAMEAVFNKPCSQCGGTGLVGEKVCPVCDGTGEAGIVNEDGRIQCQHCMGTGLWKGKECELCGGYGVLENVQKIS